MTDEKEQPKIHIDSDWKAEAAAEKERLSEAASAEKQRAPSEQANLLSIVNVLAMQAVAGLGGMKGPNNETIPPNPEAARLFIDLLAVLEEKTQGNVTDEEKKVLSSTLHELRMMYVQVAGQAPGGPTGQSPSSE